MVAGEGGDAEGLSRTGDRDCRLDGAIEAIGSPIKATVAIASTRQALSITALPGYHLMAAAKLGGRSVSEVVATQSKRNVLGHRTLDSLPQDQRRQAITGAPSALPWTAVAMSARVAHDVPAYEIH